MLLSSKYNIALARIAYLCISTVRKLLGLDDRAQVSRAGMRWDLDLREGLDLTIFVTGFFQKRVVRACTGLLPAGGVAIDIGANMGAQTLHMANAVGAKGTVIAIEPTSYPMQRLMRNVQANPELLPRVRTFQTFLTATPDDAVPDSLQSSWKVAGDRSGAHPVHLGVPQMTAGASSSTLDNLVEREGLTRIDLIKLDVDGAEDSVLAGGERILERYKPSIVIEVAPYTLVERGLAPDAPLRRLQRLGYVFEDLDGNPIGPEKLARLAAQPQGYGEDIVARHGSVVQHNQLRQNA